MYEIEIGVPIPEARNKYPFAAMQVGDSFSVPVPPGADASAFIAPIRTLCYQHGKRRGLKFAVRLCDARTTARVWRVA